QPDAGGAHGVAQGDRAAVDVELVGVDAVHLAERHRHRGERLVDLEDVDVGDAHAAAFEQPLTGAHRTVEQELRLGPDQHLGDDAGAGAQSQGARPVLVHDQGGGGPVGDLRGGPGGVDPAFTDG